MSAFYLRDGDVFSSTASTRGPWDNRSQHAGPPSALLVRAAEAKGLELELPHLARFTAQILRPVPIAPLSVELGVDKRGRSAARLSAKLLHEDRVLIRATALVLRTRAIEVKLSAKPFTGPTPEASEPFDFPFFRADVGYHTAIELRLGRGTFGQTPTFMWMRPRHPLVEGEPLSGAQRVALCADSGNGVSPVLDWKTHGFINPDLTIAWHRTLRGQWIGLDAETTVEPDAGVGTAHSRIYDLEGPVAYGLQSLLCDPL